MLVLGAVPGPQLRELRRAMPGRFAVMPARTWDEALAAIRTRPVELAVVDPLLAGRASECEIERLRVMFPSLPFILYTTLTPETAAVLLALGQRGIRHVVFVRYDDYPAHLRRVLAEEEARSTSRQLLDQLAWALAPLPSELRWVLEEVLQSPAELQTVQQVAARARGPAHLRALVHAPRVTIAPPLPRRGPGPLRAPAAAVPGVHHRGRRRASGLRPNQDAPAACPHLPRAHRW